MKPLFAAALLLLIAAPGAPAGDKERLLEAYEAGDRRKADRAAQALVDRQDETCAPVLAAAFRDGLKSLSRFKRERAKLEKELEKWTIVDEKGNRRKRGDIDKWRDTKFKYDPLTAKIESTEAALSHTITYLLRLESTAAAEGLIGVLKANYPWVARAYAAEALGPIDDPGALKALLSTARAVSTPALRVGLAHGLRHKTRASDAARELMTEWLDSDYWQVRLAAAQALSASEDRTRAFPLINQMAAEKGRMLHELNACLVKLTGVDKNSSYAAWKAWWDENREAFLEGTYSPRASERPNPKGLTSFFGVPLVSENVVFVLDASSSMKRPTRWTDDAEKDPNRPKGDRTLDVAKYELKKIISRLPNDARFNIILMRHTPESLSVGMSRVGSSRNKAKKFVEEIRVEPGTNIWGALLRCLEFAGGGWLDGLRKDSIDSIYLVSDGEHTGRVVDRTQVVPRGVQSLRFKKIAVYSIAVNAPAYGGKLLKDLAEGTEGTFVQR